MVFESRNGWLSDFDISCCCYYSDDQYVLTMDVRSELSLEYDMTINITARVPTDFIQSKEMNHNLEKGKKKPWSAIGMLIDELFESLSIKKWKRNILQLSQFNLDGNWIYGNDVFCVCNNFCSRMFLLLRPRQSKLGIGIAVWRWAWLSIVCRIFTVLK